MIILKSPPRTFDARRALFVENNGRSPLTALSPSHYGTNYGYQKFVGQRLIVQLKGFNSVSRLFLRPDKTYMLRILYTFLLFAVAPNTGERAEHVSLPKPVILRGVDVSHHQKLIDWDSVAAKEPLDFAFVKATEGGDFVDSLFCHNWDELKRLGIRRGAYHFFRAYGCGDEQAAHFLSQVEMMPGDIAPVLDIEVLDGIAPEIMLQEAKIWLELVEHQLGVKPIIYSNQHFYERYLTGHVDHYPLWIARYSEEKPFLTTGKSWEFWQFSNEGCVEGICKKVDLNVFSGTPEMLDRLCWYPEREQIEAPAISLP